MSANLAGFPPRYLRTPEASRFVGLSIRTLEKHRCRSAWKIDPLEGVIGVQN